jgi:hypothetical protein
MSGDGRGASGRRPATRRAGALAGALLAIGVAATAAPAQERVFYEQTYLPAPHNWAFRREHPTADRLFNAFDYGHAILSEILYTQPEAAQVRLEGEQFEYITGRLLVRPPRLPLADRPIAPAFAKLAPEVMAMFEWAHVLHRQLYDVWADDRIPPERKDAAVAKVLAYYRSRPDLAFSSRPKSMDLMEGQYYSRTFRERCPKFNGLIWSYHWLQMALYDALLSGASPAARDTAVASMVARFRGMVHVEGASPVGLPHVMPMSAAIAPAFAGRYPEAAIIFDNLHAMHDVVSDILASPAVPAARKRAELLLAAERYRDSASYVTSVEEWREMSIMMGAEHMGGVAVPGTAPGARHGSPARPAAGHPGHAPARDSTRPPE